MNNENASPIICPICGHGELIRDIKYVNEYWPDLTCWTELSIIGCASCGGGFCSPELRDDVIEHFYANEYRRKGEVFYVDFEGMNSRPVQLDQRALAQLQLAKHYVTFKTGDCFLDIGPGSGASFNVAQNVLLNPKCVGIEKNEGAKEAFKRVYGADTVASIDEFNATGYLAKICLLSHSLEHFKVEWLDGALSGFKNLLAPGGVLVVEVPLVDMRQHVEFRREDSPHLIFFSLDSIRILFEKNNWKILYLNACGELYVDWWAPKQDDILRSVVTSRLMKFKKIIKSILFFLPDSWYRKMLRMVLGDGMDFGGVQFSYGGDRTCLRIVVQPI